jgi:hypothetical protein
VPTDAEIHIRPLLAIWAYMVVAGICVLFKYVHEPVRVNMEYRLVWGCYAEGPGPGPQVKLSKKDKPASEKKAAIRKYAPVGVKVEEEQGIRTQYTPTEDRSRRNLGSASLGAQSPASGLGRSLLRHEPGSKKASPNFPVEERTRMLLLTLLG